MHVSKMIKSAFFGFVFSLIPMTGFAEADVCAPFKYGMVDESIVAKMLASAEQGHLYRIKPASSRVGFCVDSPVGRIEGVFKDFTGGLTFVPTAESGDGQQAMVMVNTASLETDTPVIEGMLKGKKFFDTEKFPEILFVSREFRWVNAEEAILIGDLTMHGVTKQVGFHVELIGEETPDAQAGEQKIQVKATTLISRSEFGLTSLSSVVSDMVSLCMTVEAVKFRS